jgi:hypothetical protein
VALPVTATKAVAPPKAATFALVVAGVPTKSSAPDGERK